MAAKACTVSITGTDGITRTVEVKAESVYEAAVLGLEALRKDSWTGSIGPGTKLRIEVKPPSVTHEVTVHHLQRWAESSAITPEDRLRKSRLRELLTK